MNPPVPRKPPRPADPGRRVRRQEEILDAAVKLFAQHGYSETDVQVLADTLQVGKGTIYRYFPSKKELFLAAVDRIVRQLREHLDERVAHIEDPLERIAQAIRGYLGFFTEHPELVELLIQERAQFKDRKKPTYFEHRDANVERWRALYRRLIGEGRVRPMSVEGISDVVGDLLYGSMFTNYFNGPRKPLEEQADDIIDVVFHGILSGPERQRRGVG